MIVPAMTSRSSTKAHLDFANVCSHPAKAHSDFEQVHSDPAKVLVVHVVRRHLHQVLGILLQGQQHPVDEAVLDGLGRREVEVPLKVLPDLFVASSRESRQPIVDLLALPQDLSGFDLHVRGLPVHHLRHPHVLELGRLEEEARVGEAHPLSGRPGTAQESADGRGDAKVESGDVKTHVRHRVVHSKARSDLAAWAVEVQLDSFLGVLAVEKEQHSNHLICIFVIKILTNVQNSLPVQPIPDIQELV
mmetsp:Transcript_57806/g.118321  ORF Transcript_57806/g.118321 Transcript_57806/m.118321 type:complete len:247 (-) Transcript_57806:238-978(-)